MKWASVQQPPANAAKIFLAVLLCLVFLKPAWSQSFSSGQDNPRFQHFTTNDGLSNNNVIRLFQDSRGLLWVGTENGINYFDGKTFTAFYPSDFNKAKLQNDEIGRIAEDADHNILFYNADGVYRFYWDSKTIRIVLSNAVMDMRHRVLDFFIDQNKNIWTLSPTSLDKYDASFHKLKSWRMDKSKSNSFRLAQFVANDGENNLWFSYNALLHVITHENNQDYFDDNAYAKLLALNPQSIAQDASGNFWALTEHDLF